MFLGLSLRYLSSELEMRPVALFAFLKGAKTGVIADEAHFLRNSESPV